MADAAYSPSGTLDLHVAAKADAFRTMQSKAPKGWDPKDWNPKG